ncbi:SIR2 family protein [Candidatus Acetothermia bacterium]|nr:SIR2 family protein [Candidatus Acetothermia bacterium]
MEKIIYLLGAGFSAPLDIPVMRDFWFKSLDLYLKQAIRPPHFERIFHTVANISQILKYYEADVFNIEEILSILEMQKFTQGNSDIEDFRKYIADTIRWATPIPKINCDEFLPTSQSDSFPEAIFGDIWSPYGAFACNLLNLQVQIFARRIDKTNMRCSRSKDSDAIYSIITLNYDLIFEIVMKLLTERITFEPEISFFTEVENDSSVREDKTYLAKLHGSIDPLTLTLPTWNKSSDPEIQPAWRLAGKLLENATQLRILGYSLPLNDNHVRYLLKSSTLKANRLKNIDIICLDDETGTVEQRYHEFIKFRDHNFYKIDINDYLKEILKIFKHDQRKAIDDRTPVTISFQSLEKAHASIIEAFKKRETAGG